jgi:hypothetical protein
MTGKPQAFAGAAMRRKRGRKSDYSIETAQTICTEIAGGRSVREICRDPKMPCLRSVFTWLAQNEEFREMYRAAREAQADYIFEEVLEIADDGRNDWTARQQEDGGTVMVLNKEHVNRSRLRIDARKWVLARMNAKKYGERNLTELAGPDGGAIQIENALGPLSSLDPAELQFLRGILERRAGIKSEDDAEPEEADHGDVGA